MRSGAAHLRAGELALVAAVDGALAPERAYVIATAELSIAVDMIGLDDHELMARAERLARCAHRFRALLGVSRADDERRALDALEYLDTAHEQRVLDLDLDAYETIAEVAPVIVDPNLRRAIARRLPASA